MLLEVDKQMHEKIDPEAQIDEKGASDQAEGHDSDQADGPNSLEQMAAADAADEHGSDPASPTSEPASPKEGGRRRSSGGGVQVEGLEDSFDSGRNNSSNRFGRFSSTGDLNDFDAPVVKKSLKERLEHILGLTQFQVVSAVLVLITVLLICMDTNARAQGGKASFFEDILMAICYVAYVIEFAATVYVQGRQSLFDLWNYIDAMVITISLADYIMPLISSSNDFAVLRLLRICRLLRLGRLLRSMRLLQRISWLKEVYILCMMMASCMRTLFYAFGLCFFVMTLWSILAVELLNENLKSLNEENPELWSGCSRCPRSFESIVSSNWTFFQTIVAGDSWGLVALPVIEKYPWAAIIFVGCFSSILFGILNLISAVVIDTFAERRAKDVSSVASDMEYEEVQEKKFLGNMFTKIDEDRSGAVSLEELREGAVKVREFRHYLRVLDIDDNDLGELFGMIDYDGSGEVDPEEFIEALYRMKNTDPKTATRFVKHMVSTLTDRQKVLDDRLDGVQDAVLQRLAAVEGKLLGDLEESISQKDVQDLLDTYSKNIDDNINKAIEKAAAVALDAGMDSAIAKASQAMRKVIAASTNRTLEISERVNQLCGPGIDSVSEGAFGRQVTPSGIGTSLFRQVSCGSKEDENAPPAPKHSRSAMLLCRPPSSSTIIQLGDTIFQNPAPLGSKIGADTDTATMGQPSADSKPERDVPESATSNITSDDVGISSNFNSVNSGGPKGPCGTPSGKFIAKTARVLQKPPKVPKVPKAL